MARTRQGRQLAGMYAAFRDDIYKLCSALNFEPTWQQRLVLDAVMRAANKTGPKRIAVKSGQGPGKTTISAVTSLWRCFRHVDALTVLTAPTMEQCKENFLKECRRLHGEADPLLQQLFEVTKTRVIFARRPDWGVKLKASTKPENAQGKHNENMSIIVDEASGVDREILEQYEGTLTNEDALMLLIGNPNTRDCGFFDCFNSLRHRWHCITLNAEESPIVSKENIEYIAEKYGRDSDVYRVRILGEFPLMDPNCVMSSEDLEACTRNDRIRCALVPTRRGDKFEIAKQFGLDFARYGDDENVAYRRSGLALVEELVLRKTDPSILVAGTFRAQKRAHWTDSDTVFVADAGGMGQGTMHLFYGAKKRVVEFHNNGRARDSKTYDNKITEAFFQMAAHAKARRLYIPTDPRLIQQLSNRQYHMTKDGKIIIETKDDYKKRGFPSPDRADAAVMAYYDQVVVDGQTASRHQGSARQIGDFGLRGRM